MIAIKQMDVSPLPKPLGLAFAETLTVLPLPVGLLFHLAHVTVWSMAFVVPFRNSLSLSLRNALLLALLLWIGVLVVFFPIVARGMFGLAIGPMLIPGSFMPHLLFGLFLLGLARLFFPTVSRARHAAGHRFLLGPSARRY